MVLFQKLAQKYQDVFPEFFKSCPNLPPLRTPIALTQKLWRNTSYLQLSGLNNRFYVVITIFAQHVNICSPKLGYDGAICPHLATRQPTVTGGCVVLNLLLQFQTRTQLTLAMKRQIWHG